MSQNISNNQIRRYAFNPQFPALGLAAFQATCEFEASAKISHIQFGASSIVTTVPANDPLLPAWLLGIDITINNTEHIVRNMNRADYINLIQNTEMREADIILNGNMLFKKFEPPLPVGTKVQIILQINTLALATTTPAATANLILQCIAYDTQKPAQRKMTYYNAIQNFPEAVGYAANIPIDRNLGVHARIEKFICIIEETAGAPTDTDTGLIELLANGNPVIQLPNPAAKNHYAIKTDGILPPAGWYMLKCPHRGFQTAEQQQLSIRLTPFAANVAGQYRAYEVFEKAY